MLRRYKRVLGEAWKWACDAFGYIVVAALLLFWAAILSA